MGAGALPVLAADTAAPTSSTGEAVRRPRKSPHSSGDPSSPLPPGHHPHSEGEAVHPKYRVLCAGPRGAVRHLPPTPSARGGAHSAGRRTCPALGGQAPQPLQGWITHSLSLGKKGKARAWFASVPVRYAGHRPRCPPSRCGDRGLAG